MVLVRMECLLEKEVWVNEANKFSLFIRVARHFPIPNTSMILLKLKMETTEAKIKVKVFSGV